MPNDDRTNPNEDDRGVPPVPRRGGGSSPGKGPDKDHRTPSRRTDPNKRLDEVENKPDTDEAPTEGDEGGGNLFGRDDEEAERPDGPGDTGGEGKTGAIR